MRKKRFLMEMWALAFALALTACGGKTAQAQTGGGNAAVDAAADLKEAAGAVKDALAAVKKSDVTAFANAIKDKTAAELAALVEQSASPGGDFTYELDEAGTGVVIKTYTGTSPILIYPQTIEGYPVVKIINTSDSSSKRNAVAAVVIPEGVREIDFYQGSKLQSVVFPSTLEKARWVPQGYKNLPVIDLSHTAITDLSGFEFPPNVQTIKLPAGLKTIGLSQFRYCGELTNLVIPDSITQLPFETAAWNDQHVAFEGCSKLPLATRKRIQELGYTGTFQ